MWIMLCCLQGSLRVVCCGKLALCAVTPALSHDVCSRAACLEWCQGVGWREGVRGGRGGGRGRRRGGGLRVVWCVGKYPYML